MTSLLSAFARKATIDKIIRLLAIEYPFAEIEIKRMYDVVGSIDNLIAVCEIAAVRGLTINSGYREYRTMLAAKG